MKTMLYAIEGSFYYHCDNTSNAFKYLASAFMDSKNNRSGYFEWPDVIKDNFNLLLKSIKKKNGINTTPSDEYVKILNSNEILANAWIQWGILIQADFCQKKINDILTALLAMKCYIIASKLISKKKCDSVVARVCIIWKFIKLYFFN